VLAAGISVGCAGCAGRPATPDAPAASVATVAWDYDVTARRGGLDGLAVEARFAPGGDGVLRVDDDAAPFVRDVTYAAGGQWQRVDGHDSSWTVPCASGCSVRYRYELPQAAAKLDDPETAIGAGDALVAPPATWLLRPASHGGRFRLRVAVDRPWSFAMALSAPPGAPAGTFEAPTESLEDSAFAAFGALDIEPIERGSMRIRVAIAPGLGPLSPADVTRWIETAVDALAAYYGRSFLDRVLVIVLPGRPGNPTRGETLGVGGPAVLVRAASGSTPAATRDDWVVTHELIHVSLPSLGHEHAWLSEGIATYVEPIVRARAGLVSVETYWRELALGLPQGLPEAGDRGLERTDTWGRTYWGGALFCFAADVAIREQTGNTRSFDDALRGVVATGADVEARWTVERFLDVGDRATGTRVLEDLYRTMALAPGSVDLAAIWRRLGVHADTERVTFDDDAPLAAVRHAMTAAARARSDR
jgi:hypothetical protein